MFWLIIIVIIICIIIVKVVYELHHLKLINYVVKTDKPVEGLPLRFVFISDLHGRRYGDKNEELIEMVKNARPEVILLGGDMVVSSANKNEDSLYELLESFSKISPVFYAPGNHEMKLKENIKFESDRFEKLSDHLKKTGIIYLSNSKKKLSLNDISGNDAEKAGYLLRPGISINGLDQGYEFFDRKVKKKLSVEDIEERLGKCDKKDFNILLSHDPGDFRACSEYGADLVLAGHYHGGAVRIGKVGLISPQFKLFPKYSAGRFEMDKTTMIVTKGAGSHSVNLRLFNYPEVVVVEIKQSR